MVGRVVVVRRGHGGRGVAPVHQRRRQRRAHRGVVVRHRTYTTRSVNTTYRVILLGNSTVTNWVYLSIVSLMCFYGGRYSCNVSHKYS